MPRPRRKSPRPTKSAKIDAEAHKRLDYLQDEIAKFDLPSYVDQMEILSAAVMFVTPEQLHGMILGYWRYTNRLRREAEATEQERVDARAGAADEGRDASASRSPRASRDPS